VPGKLTAEPNYVTRQHTGNHPLVFAGDVMHVAVGPMIDLEIEAKLALPPVPQVLQDAVTGEVVEEPVEAKMCVDARGEVVSLWWRC
jgi:hypothetical protein